MEASRQAWPQHRSLFRRSRWLPRGFSTTVVMLAAVWVIYALTQGQ